MIRTSYNNEPVLEGVKSLGTRKLRQEARWALYCFWKGRNTVAVLPIGHVKSNVSRGAWNTSRMLNGISNGCLQWFPSHEAWEKPTPRRVVKSRFARSNRSKELIIRVWREVLHFPVSIWALSLVLEMGPHLEREKLWPSPYPQIVNSMQT